ncbi:MAG: hypothetical protein LBQ89_08285 [Treponema sp.]|jgi:hypothetical protein|nr:hypothetical protein [Treponema sp.]
MDITTARVEPHERAKNEDFEFGYQSIIRNTAILDRMLTSLSVDYLAGGKVRAVSGTMTITVDALWANGRKIDLPAHQDVASNPIAISIPTLYPRYSIVQVRGMLQSFDNQQRAFYDPELEVALFRNIDTKNRLIPEIVVKNGNEGVIYAPEADTGYVKIAEIYLEPEITEILQDNIRNVSALYQGSENTQWTSEKTRTFYIGSMSDIWEVFNREHFADGQHREAVIKASNILLGVVTDALKGSNISVGENVNSGDLSLLATKTLIEALSSIGQILQGNTSNTLLKKLFMLISWRNNETYQPFAPTFFQGRIYYANPFNLPMIGESPGNAPDKWVNAAGDVAFFPPQDGRLYGMRNRAWTELESGGLAIHAWKFYSKRTLMITNARIVDRRLRRWDLGIPYLSTDHEVYHFDTDNKNQDQESNIIINYNNEPPVRCGKEDSTEELSFEPVVSDLVPFEMMGKSLFGMFSVSGFVAAQNSTLEFWMRIFVTENSVLLRLGTQVQDLITLNIGGADPEYSVAAPGDIPYSHQDLIDGIPYSHATTTGNTLYHDWGEGNETVDLDAAGIELNQNVWLHIAFVLTPSNIILFIGDHELSFTRYRPVIDPLPFILNEDLNLFNLDELSIINGAMIDHAAFVANNADRVPYAALDYHQKYAVFMVDDPVKFRTNIFESDQFREAVQGIINGN